MKPPILFFVLFALLVGGAIAANQTQASVLSEPELTLIYLPLAAPEEGARLPQSGLTIYARVNGRDSPAVLAGAVPAGRHRGRGRLGPIRTRR